MPPAYCPGATVTARHVQSGFTHEAITATDGAFALAGLRPGQYQITVSVSQVQAAGENC